LEKSNTNRAPVQLSWHNVVIKTSPKSGCLNRVDPNAQPKRILDGVSGCVKPGNFLSIIGASGAGKTTLLNYLSGRLISQNLNKTGKILVNG
jgi:ABC-type multidrug transport system ATPase subunit